MDIKLAQAIHDHEVTMAKMYFNAQIDRMNKPFKLFSLSSRKIKSLLQEYDLKIMAATNKLSRLSK